MNGIDTIEFPGLWGLKFDISRVAFTIFGRVPIYWYGIIIAAAFMTAVILGMRRSRVEGIDTDSLLDMVLFATPAAIIGARLYYVIFSWELFRDNLLDIFNTRKGGLAIYGGIIGAFAVAYLYARIKKLNFLKIFDMASPYFLLAQGIGRWGNFVNQEAFGTNTALPWGMISGTTREYLMLNQSLLETKYGITVDPSLPVHPTFLYESLWDIAAFLFLLWFRKRKKLDGELFLLYMALYGFGRFFIEGIRTDSLMLGNLRISQLVAALLVVVPAFIFFRRRRKAEDALEEERIAMGESKYGNVLKEMLEERLEGDAGISEDPEPGTADEQAEGEERPEALEKSPEEADGAKEEESPSENESQ